MSLIVEATSPVHSLQDAGRFGYSRFGISNAGAADLMSFYWANWLLDNPADTATLELVGGGFACTFTDNLTIALTGAHCGATLNGSPVEPWVSLAIKAGDSLRLGSPRAGRIAYLALAGGFDCPPALGSLSVARRDGLGGWDGQGTPLQRDQVLPVRPRQVAPKAVPRRFVPDYRRPVLLNLMPGFEFDQFSAADRAALTAQPFQLSRQVDRMGARLEDGPVLRPPRVEYSSPIPLGAVQVPADGNPIVLMRDRQSLGGYAKLGCVCRESIGALIQRPAGTAVGFTRVEVAAMQARMNQVSEFFGVRAS